MISKDVLFIVPTLFHSPSFTKECVDSLLRSVKNETRFTITIAVVANRTTSDFEKWDVPDGVIKLCSHENFNISKAINTAIDVARNTNYDYFCYVDEGMRFKSGWLSEYFDTYVKLGSMVGILGARAHSTFNYYHKEVKSNLFEVLWTDGLMFTEMSKVLQVGPFDENYKGDGETQDYCYRMKTTGNYLNYFIKSDYVFHKNSPSLKETLTQHDLEKLEWMANRSRVIFAKKWENWRSSQYLF